MGAENVFDSGGSINCCLLCGYAKQNSHLNSNKIKSKQTPNIPTATIASVYGDYYDEELPKAKFFLWTIST